MTLSLASNWFGTELEPTQSRSSSDFLFLRTEIVGSILNRIFFGPVTAPEPEFQNKGQVYLSDS